MKILDDKLRPYKLLIRKPRSIEESEKYWTIRRESFNLLRKHIHGSRTAPFVDDVVVRPEDMPEFLAGDEKDFGRLQTRLHDRRTRRQRKLSHYSAHGYARSAKCPESSKKFGNKVYDLVCKYHGSITGEHNDGIVRTPYLDKMYSPEILELFKQVKNIFDPQNIFNPGKKVNGTLEYMAKHIAIE